VTSSEELDIDWDGRSIQQVQKVRGTKVGVMIRMLKSGRFAKRRPKSCKPEVDRRQGHSRWMPLIPETRRHEGV
jgi:hypothetical protein